ncbi:hypothetical protein CDG61_00585 [Acinetobacter sp. WCHAc010052]|nr:hypothetical protein CDG61_00585 [Acinetobacter sp. WCHAc010052]
MLLFLCSEHFLCPDEMYISNRGSAVESAKSCSSCKLKRTSLGIKKAAPELLSGFEDESFKNVQPVQYMDL